MPDLGHPSGFSAAEGDGAAVAGRRLVVRGVVQGVGFRPFVFNLATRLGLSGWVRNTSAGVEIEVAGRRAAVEEFVAALPREKPPRAYIADLGVEDVTRDVAIGEGAAGGDAVGGHAAGDDGAGDVATAGSAAFTILESAADPAAYQLVSPDIALCDDCRRELLDPQDRRFRYPFTNCTNCGPRFTIIEGLPYDRERTTMRGFELCPDCRREYEDPRDRRFHAEPNACPVCGPRLSVADASGTVVATGDHGAIETVVRALLADEIVAVKGLGGFHLACDATSDAAVAKLKARKGRPHKPLAVMFGDLEQARLYCVVDDDEARLLESVEHPIVLVEWPRAEGSGAGSGARAEAPAGISAEVAVRQRFLGAMLPYTPLHELLLREAGRPLVMTSGNLAEEPIVKGWEEAGRLSGIPDLFLLHDREIAARYDDSVALVRRRRPRLLRRSRGYAPFPVRLPRAQPQVLACGAELKNTFCLTRDDNAFLSQHIGDLENLETLEHFESSIVLYERLFRLEPEVVAHDLHPEYLATKFALALPDERGGAPVEKLAVQHHHAHVAACMVENGRVDSVIGVSMDGLGYGDDGRLWGGEVLVCDLLGYRRAAHLEYLPLAGGELAIRRPARTAAGWLLALLGEDALETARRLGLVISDDEAAAVARQIATGVNAPLTSSCGRLFDAVAALAGVRSEVTYEAQAAIELEMVSRAGAEPYPWDIADQGDVPTVGTATAGAGGTGVSPARPMIVRLAPMFEAVLGDLAGGATPAGVGSRLHATVAALVAGLCRRLRDDEGLGTVALSGGVFQNRLLTESCEARLEEDGFDVLTHALVPANDGGLSLGQAAVAGYTVMKRRGLLD